MSEPSHCAVQVLRVTDSQRNTKDAKLFVKIRLGELIRKTGRIDDDGRPAWHDTFTFPRLDPSTVFNVELKKSRRVLRVDLVGRADITVAQLITESAEHEVRLTPQSSSQLNFGRQGHVATIVLSYREIDALSRATIDVEVAEQGVERIKDSGEKLESSIDVIGSVKEVVDTVVEVIDKVAEIHPLLQVSWKAASALYKLVSHQYENDIRLVNMVNQLRNAHDFTSVAKDLKDDRNVIKPKLRELLDETSRCSQFVQKYVKYNFAMRMARIRDRDRIDGFSERFISLRGELDSVIGVTAANAVDEVRQQQTEVNKEVTDMRLQQQLEYHLNPSTLDASGVSERPRCLEGTREEYLGPIMDLLSSNDAPNVLWLTGAAGSGKSTIAVTASDRCDNEGCNAAYIFFEREKSEPGSAIRTIAYRLAKLHRPFALHLSDACGKNKNISGNTLKVQFEVLLLAPLKAIENEETDRVVIILDALDECGPVRQREELLSLLKSDFARLPSKVRVLITSRPENDTMKDLSLKRHIRLVPIEHKSNQSQHDVSRYIRETMSELFGESTTKEEGWDRKMRILCEAADGLFIWASTAVEMVKHSDVMQEQLDALLEDIRSIGEYGIDDLYATALKNSGIMWGSPKSKDRFAKVIGLVVLAKEGLSTEDIMAFLELKEVLMEATLGRLLSVLSYRPGHAVHLHHASFADYLLSDERSGGQSWHINTTDQRLAIAERCLDIMASTLRFNICGIESSFVYNKDIPDLQERIKKNVPPHLNYACRFWAAHVCELPKSLGLNSLMSKLRTFAHTHLLYWLEVLSLTGNCQIAVRSLSEVSMWTAVQDEGLSSFLRDASRFAHIFALPIMESLPHIYVSAVALLHEESSVSAHYSKCLRSMVRTERKGIKRPAHCLKMLTGHSNCIYSVSVSLDGKRLASASDDRTVRVWDLDSGEETPQRCIKFPQPVRSVRFFPDSRRIVLGGWDGTVAVYDAEIDDIVLGPLEGHTKRVTTVAVSPDGSMIASGSYDDKIIVRDASGGSILFCLTDHTYGVNSVSFSPDSTRLASGSIDKTAKIWDVKSAKLVVSLPHNDRVESVAFSPKGRYVVTGSGREITIWDLEEGTMSPVPSGHTGLVSSVGFSPCGTQVISSGSLDGTLIIWDTVRRELHNELVGHTQAIRCFTSSPDGKYIVSGSEDNTIRIWDATVNPVGTAQERHTDTVLSLAFSADASRIASASDNGSIIIWDALTGRATAGPLSGHSEPVTFVAFAPDNSRLILGSSDGTIGIWNVGTGHLIPSTPLEGPTDDISCIAVSADCTKLLASGSWDNTIKVWDIATGAHIAGPSRDHSGCVLTVAFSLDGSQLASRSDDGSIIVWDTHTWNEISECRGWRGGPLDYSCFSPDTSLLAFGTQSGDVRICGVKTGQTVHDPFEGHSDVVHAISFFPDSSHIVSGSRDSTIRVWNVKSGQPVLTLEGHSDSVRSLALSPDGTQLVSGSSDNTVRVWNLSDLGRHRDSELADRSSSSREDVFDWVLDDEGWIRDGQNQSNLLLWIPPHLRSTLLRPRNTFILSCDFSTKVDFTNAAIGDRWTECSGT